MEIFKMANSPMNEEEKKQVSDAMASAAGHTIHLLSEPGKDGSRYGIGSGVMARYRENRIVVSADHLIRPETIRLLYDFPGFDYNTNQPSTKEDALEAKPLYRDDSIDLLIIDGKPLRNVVAEGYIFYDLERSRGVTPEKLAEQIGGTLVISGYWGANSQFEPTRTTMWMLASPPYQAKGQLLRVSDSEIIARFEEHEVLFRNVEAFPQLKGVEPNTGGSRNLKGTSGSGLWAICPDGIRLCGIIREAETEVGDPNICFLPVWVILRELDGHWKAG